MSYRKVVLGLVVSGLATVLTAGMAFAQADGGGAAGTGGGGGAPGGGPGGGRPGRGNSMANMMNNIKDQLAVTDDEWTVLQPKLQKVMDLNRELMTSRFAGFRGGRGGRGGGPGGGGDTAAPAGAPAQPTNEIADKTAALRTTLENKDADPKDIAQKLAALRDARERVKADLVKAQGELKELLTPRQEAQLVMMGMLD